MLNFPTPRIIQDSFNISCELVLDPHVLTCHSELVSESVKRLALDPEPSLGRQFFVLRLLLNFQIFVLNYNGQCRFFIIKTSEKNFCQIVKKIEKLLQFCKACIQVVYKFKLVHVYYKNTKKIKKLDKNF